VKSVKNKTIMMVAGEVSGDMHAARVVQALRSKNKKLRVFGMGGPQMAAAGMDVREDLTRQAIMGFFEVVKKYPVIRKRFKQCEEWLQKEKPNLLVLVDYPGFNLRLAQSAHRLGIPVCYYIAPKVWTWNPGRIKAMKKVISKLLVIFPFETAYFRRHGLKAVYVGNPLMDEMDLGPVKKKETLKAHGIELSRFPVVCAMPGSRKGEIEKIWPLYLKAARRLLKTCPDAAFVVPQSIGLTPDDFGGITADDPFFFVDGPAYELRKACDLAWVKSGTGTLETALLGTPMIMVYRMAPVMAFLARKLVKLKDVSLVNLLARRTLVPELLQEQANPKRLVAETLRILDKPRDRELQLKGFEKIRKDLTITGKASEKAASEILKLLGKSH
jgi:lipid-A-disaccharide synthase